MVSLSVDFGKMRLMPATSSAYTKWGLIFLPFFAIFVFAYALSGSGKASAEVTNAHIGTFTNSEGKTFQTICVDWKNTGSKPIRVVSANLKAFNQQGQLVEEVPNYVIFARSAPVNSGETYTEPDEDSYLVIPMETPGPITSVEATITSVKTEMTSQ